jgi:NAD(P)H-flavin reductase
MSPLEAEIALLERELRGERARADRLQVKNKFLRERVGYMREDVEERWVRLIAERDAAFARGAEAMRGAVVAHLAEYAGWGMMEPRDVKEEICALPIPEEP